MPDEKPSLPGLILVPAALTLAVTLLRLIGELQRWSPRLFSREAGGPGALVGIVWLIPVFGVWFALRLARTGQGPARASQALGWALVGFVLNGAAVAASVALFPKDPVLQIGIFSVTSWVAIFVARRGWPELWRVLLAYGLAARLPVVVIMFFSIFGGWDTHYSKPRPDFPPLGPAGVFFWTGVLPQLAIWIWLTVIGGILFGALAVMALRVGRKPVVVALASAALLSTPAQARDGKRIFISVDMEGIGGAVTDQQLGTAGFEYQKFRELMTEEANAAIAAAREAGASEFVVADSHGNFQNLLPDKLPGDVQLVRGGPRPLSMMQGIDDSFDGVIYVGYHSSTTNPDGVRAHTMSSAYMADLRLNGVSVTEGAWNAALAGHFGVPILAVSGDEAAVKEVQALVAGVEGAIVKWPYGFHSARVLSPEASRQAIRDAVKKAMARRTQISAHRLKTPVEVEIRFKAYRPAEVLGWLPLFKRIDAHAVRFSAKDMPEATRILAFVMNYQFDLQP